MDRIYVLLKDEKPIGYIISDEFADMWKKASKSHTTASLQEVLYKDLIRKIEKAKADNKKDQTKT